MKTLYKIKLWLKKRSENKAKKRIFKSKVNNYIDMLIADFAVKDYVSYRLTTYQDNWKAFEAALNEMGLPFNKTEEGDYYYYRATLDND